MTIQPGVFTFFSLIGCLLLDLQTWIQFDLQTQSSPVRRPLKLKGREGRIGELGVGGKGWGGVSFTPSTSRFSMSTVEQTWGRRRSKALLIRRAIGFNAGSDILQTVLLSGCPPSLRTQLTLRTQQAAPTNRRFIGLPRFLQISTPLVRFRLPFLYSLQKQSA